MSTLYVCVSVVTRVRGEVRAGALTSEDRNPAEGPLVDPPSTWFAVCPYRGLGMSCSLPLRTFLSLSMCKTAILYSQSVVYFL